MDEHCGDAFVGHALGHFIGHRQTQEDFSQMNRKQLLLLIILVLVLGGLGLFVFKKQTASYTSSGGSLGQKVVGDFAVNDVTQVQIKQPEAEVKRNKTEETLRVVERYESSEDSPALAEMPGAMAQQRFL